MGTLAGCEVTLYSQDGTSQVAAQVSGGSGTRFFFSSQVMFPASIDEFAKLSGVASGRNVLPSGQVLTLARPGFIATLILPVQVLNSHWGLGSRGHLHTAHCSWPGDSWKLPFFWQGKADNPLGALHGFTVNKRLIAP